MDAFEMERVTIRIETGCGTRPREEWGTGGAQTLRPKSTQRDAKEIALEIRFDEHIRG